jgi:hypothetical protein
MNKYLLVNPIIGGNLQTDIKADTPLIAADLLWVKISNYITNNVPNLYFSIQDMKTNKLYHFSLKETSASDDKLSNLIIKEINVDLSSDNEKKFLLKSENIKNTLQSQNRQNGGRRKHRHRHRDDSSSSDSLSDSSSDSSSDDESLLKYIKMKKKTQKQAINYWWYNPTLYNVDTTFIPTFTYPLTPYVQLWVSTRYN